MAIQKNDKMLNLLTDKDFVLSILKMPSADDVQKAFVSKGVELDKKDVDSLGQAFNNISTVISKYSAQEVEQMANTFENLDSKQLSAVTGGGFWDALAVLDVSGQNELQLIDDFCNDSRYWSITGSMNEKGKLKYKNIERVLSQMSGFRNAVGGNIESFITQYKANGGKSALAKKPAIGNNSTTSAPATVAPTEDEPDAPAGSSNAALYWGGGILAVSALGMAFAFRKNIKSWFSK